MDDLIKRLCLRLAGPTPGQLPAVGVSMLADGAVAGSSRRGFIATMGKVAVGAAAAVAGTALFTRPSEAASAMHCCEGIACPFYGCYHGMALGYTWSCAGYFCHDCFTDYGRGQYYCTYTVARAVHTTSYHTSSHHTSSHHTSSHHTSSSHHVSTPSYSYGEYGSYRPDYYGPPPGFFGWG